VNKYRTRQEVGIALPAAGLFSYIQSHPAQTNIYKDSLSHIALCSMKKDPTRSASILTIISACVSMDCIFIKLENYTTSFTLRKQV